MNKCSFCQSGAVEIIAERTTGIQDKEGIERTHTSIVACLRCGRVSVHRNKSFDARGNTSLPEVPVTDAGPVLGSSQGIEEVTEARELREGSNRVTEQFQKDEEELQNEKKEVDVNVSSGNENGGKAEVLQSMPLRAEEGKDGKKGQVQKNRLDGKMR